jgi:hypothetical protein
LLLGSSLASVVIILIAVEAGRPRNLIIGLALLVLPRIVLLAVVLAIVV